MISDDTLYTLEGPMETIERPQPAASIRSILETTPFSYARWIEGTPDALKNVHWISGTKRVEDDFGNLVCLFESEWGVGYMAERNPGLRFLESPAELARAAG